MPVIDVYNMERIKTGELNLSDKVFNCEPDDGLVHSVLRMQLLNKRAGNASTKTRGEVRGGGKKPWRQKHTGRARAGSIRSPLWKGGGTIFGPKPREWLYKIPKNLKRKAMCSVLTAKFRDKQLVVLEDIKFPEKKTKLAKELFKKFELDNALVLIDRQDENTIKSIRNLEGFRVLPCDSMNIYEILKYKYLVCTKGSVEKIEKVLTQ
jgi:large subunit ribosomal protein L4